MQIVRYWPSGCPLEKVQVHREEENESRMTEIERKERFAVIQRLLDVLCKLGLERVGEEGEYECGDGFASAWKGHQGGLLRRWSVLRSAGAGMGWRLVGIVIAIAKDVGRHIEHPC